MIEIENFTLDDGLCYLKPYQKKTIEQLISAYGVDKAAEEWINARGPMQTATFGGVTENSANSKNYWSSFKNEFDKLICGGAEYQEEHKKLIAAGKPIGLGAVSLIADWLAPVVGMSTSLLIPAIVLVLSTIGKMGVNAYCSYKGNNLD